ncbi:hypothetical protein K435DRAFT_808390 [Dendrothele bispora CBS 962.96]|uniref:Cytochrome P450 n=1 Tax=Dendrothele bispora (strain CBS 962.96) TaxID=1314807 RepID=A0A4S8L1N7_DENBC|nr:hypothetical protein K435DRAFT_808390 [Dendrothele bispora CBS 962.96]
MDINFITLLFALALAFVFFLSRRRQPTPPGPPGLPLLGNFLDLPKKEAWKTYIEWGKKYNSDFLSMKVPSQRFFILNSSKVYHDLLVKKSTIYSDRSTPMMNMIKRLRD